MDKSISGSPGEFFRKLLWHRNRSPARVVEEYHARPHAGDLRLRCTVDETGVQLKAGPRDFSNGNIGTQDIAVKRLSTKHDERVSHDEACPGALELCISVSREKTDAGLVHNGQDGIVPEVTAIIDVGDPDRHLNTEVDRLGKHQRWPCHVRSVLAWSVSQGT